MFLVVMLLGLGVGRYESTEDRSKSVDCVEGHVRPHRGFGVHGMAWQA